MFAASFPSVIGAFRAVLEIVCLQTSRDARERVNSIRPALHSIQSPVRGIEKLFNRFPVPWKNRGPNTDCDARKFTVFFQPLADAPAYRDGCFFAIARE
jgi:hypothetical protein